MVKSVSENKLMTTPATIGITCTSSSKSTAGAISRYGTTPRRSHHCRRGPDAGPGRFGKGFDSHDFSSVEAAGQTWPGGTEHRPVPPDQVELVRLKRLSRPPGRR